MKNQPYVSVLLPIYNGEEYVESAITSIVNQIDKDFELLISIDSNTDASEKIARRFEASDLRIKVYTHNERLGMRGNYNFLVEKAKGSWLTILGQDDAMMPFAISELRESARKNEDLSALVSRRAYAFWPDTDGAFGKYQFIYPIRENKTKQVSSREFLSDCLKGKFQYSQGPQLYTGSFISSNLIAKLLSNQNGDLFPYPIPDVSSSASILLYSESFHFSNLPLFIVGTSGKSTGVLIDKSLKDINAQGKIEKLYLDSFDGDNQKFVTPGLGIFSTFSWYLFEAASQITHSDRLSSLNFDPTWALAALRVENRGSKKKNVDLMEALNRLRDQLGARKTSLYLKVIRVRMFKVNIQICKHINALALLLQRRLILEPTSKQFDMTKLIQSTSQSVYKKLPIN